MFLVVVGAREARAEDGLLGLRMQTSATTVRQGETFRLDVTLTVRGQDSVDEIEGPDLTDFTIVGQSESNNASFSFGGGRRAVVVEHRRSYMLRADDAGTKQIGEATAKLDENIARAAPIAVRVVGNGAHAGNDDDTGDAAAAAAAAGAPGAAADAVAAPHTPGARFQGRELPDVFLEVRADKDTAVVGQQVGVVTEVWSQVPLGQYPRVPGPKPAGFVCLSLNDGEQMTATMQSLRGRNWYVYPVARDALFPLSPGKKQLPVVNVDVTPAGSFFRRTTDIRLTSEPLSLDVTPLPDDAPAGFFAGNVGLWELRVSARPTRVQAGEPFTLVVEVSGVGNVDGVEAPTWDGTPDVRLFPPTVRRERNDRDGVVAGHVVVETLVQPGTAGTVHVPSLSLVTYSPDEGRYVTRTAPPVDVVVGQGAVGAPAPTSTSKAKTRHVDVGQGPRPLALDIDPRGARVDDDAVVAYGAAVGALAAASGVVLGLRRRRVATSAGQARRRRDVRAAALDDAGTRQDLGSAQRLLLDALAERCGDDVRGAPSAEWEQLLPSRGLEKALVDRVVAAVRAVEAARYAPGGAQKAALDDVVAAARAVDGAATEKRADVAPEAA